MIKRENTPARFRFHGPALISVSLVSLALVACTTPTTPDVAAAAAATPDAAAPAAAAPAAAPPAGATASPVLSFANTGGTQSSARSYNVRGVTYRPLSNGSGYSARGLASWYGNEFHGRRTANGEVFDQYELTAAHTTLPLPSYARVTNTQNGRSVIVRINDRGPFHSSRIIDLSRGAAVLLGVTGPGVAPVQVEYVGPAPLNVDDDAYLLASYRDGSPAPASPLPEIVVAAATPPATPAAQAPIVVAAAQAAVGVAAALAPAGAEPADTTVAVTTTTATSTFALAAIPVPPSRPAADAATAANAGPVAAPVRMAVAVPAEYLLEFAPTAEATGAAAAVEVLAAAAAPAPAIQLGVFGNAEGAARLAATMAAFGEVETTPISGANGTFSSLRLVALSPGVTTAQALAAAAAAGAADAFVE